MPRKLYEKHIGPWNGKPYEFDTSARSPEANQLDRPVSKRLPSNFFSNLAAWRRSTTRRSKKLAWMPRSHGLSISAAQGHGILLWFDSVLADGITLTNRPGAPRLIYGQAFLPWPEPLEVNPGDTVTVAISARLVGDEYVWRWDTQLVSKNSSNGAKAAISPVNFLRL